MASEAEVDILQGLSGSKNKGAAPLCELILNLSAQHCKVLSNQMNINSGVQGLVTGVTPDRHV